MLELHIKTIEGWDEVTNEFYPEVEATLKLEHSLVSLSKWEAKWMKPFYKPNMVLTNEELLDYVKCMNMTQNVDPKVYGLISRTDFAKIEEYIKAPMTATTFAKENKQGSGTISREIVTSELIYYWMITLNIPFECQKWHLNRLLTLINVCQIKNTPPKKMSQRDIVSRNAALNASRKAALGIKG